MPEMGNELATLTAPQPAVVSFVAASSQSLWRRWSGGWRFAQAGLLAEFKYAVIAGAIGQDAGRNGLKADRVMFGLGQNQMGDRASEPAIAGVKRVQGDKPEVGREPINGLIRLI
jgi:hypothetical protein